MAGKFRYTIRFINVDGIERTVVQERSHIPLRTYAFSNSVWKQAKEFMGQNVLLEVGLQETDKFIFVDEDGLLKGLPANKSFPKFVGPVVVLTKEKIESAV